MTDTMRSTTTSALDVVAVSRHTRSRQLLHEVSFSLPPGEMTAIVGGSGAGKTTLLETMAGLRLPSAGTVVHDGAPIQAGSTRVGYVPQDDVIHRELPLHRTLRYAARLRLPAGTSASDAERIVDETLRALDLADRGDVRVGDLSGGQRKRASIAVELLTRPRLFFLDEPTSGLDPSTSAEVLGVLRDLAGAGVTVVLTTHSPADIEACDRVVFLARGGHLAFAGTPAEAKAYFEVDHLSQVYRLLSDASAPPASIARPLSVQVRPSARSTPTGTIGPFRQWALLVRRSADVMARSPLTLAVLLGSPALVTVMMAVLFRPGLFAASGPDALGPSQLIFWLAFAGFFFGVTYGLLQIVGELPVLRRERFAGLHLGAYVLAKVAVLTPLLALVAAVLLGVLRALDRLPSLGWRTYGALFLVLLVESIAALGMGLLASAAVADPAQATLALPMLCFPQVLFAGAIVPVPQMALPGRLTSFAMANRWGFEALGRVLPLEPRGAPNLAPYADAFSGPALTGVVVLAASAAVLLVAAVGVLRRRS